ncbi:uncharacterized protein J8A68_005104 [[Candida] subhashii]|uniref:NAD-dependent epimerase/dehydratase domain-containing protein n=1 Tax=[Candida] subhashii TaxID=561895 RepID=A0A8J5Q481_9ASCO|nr:uncharacterized protein J8A68_005104 [[Candida] subhashii]KAG7661409.1 hypothetical protein J8A68_005104 [[Candida] subhashii]
MSSTTVLVTGANGYIAQHLVQQLLLSGYKVIGTIRTKEKAERYSKLFNNENLTLEVVPKLESKGAIDEVLKQHPDITVVAHLATPPTSGNDIENEIIKPTVDFAKNVFASIKTHAPQVTRVIYASSIFVMEPPNKLFDTTHPLKDNTWHELTFDQSKSDKMLAYCYSKRIAEELVWEFVETENPNFKLSTILPGGSYGPLVFDEDVTDPMPSSSNFLCQLVTLKKEDPIPQFGLPTTDVRDVARAIIVAFNSGAAVGKRLVAVNGKSTSDLLVELISKYFPDKYDLPDVSVDVSQFAIDQFDKSNEVLGLKYIPLDRTVIDSVSQVLRVKEKGTS